jgi:hypothetical protein
MDDDLSSDGETVRLKAKPNAFLYALEATRIWLLIVLCIAAVLALCIHLANGLPIAFLALLALVICCVLYLIFLAVVIFRALGMVFVITNKTVIARLSVMERTLYQVSIPIESIKRIEVRCYGPRYGSVYLERYTDLDDVTPRTINLKTRPGWASIWFSLPWSWPPLTGFYGFRNYDAFAKLIAAKRVRGG